MARVTCVPSRSHYVAVGSLEVRAVPLGRLGCATSAFVSTVPVYQRSLHSPRLSVNDLYLPRKLADLTYLENFDRWGCRRWCGRACGRCTRRCGWYSSGWRTDCSGKCWSRGTVSNRYCSSTSALSLADMYSSNHVFHSCHANRKVSWTQICKRPYMNVCMRVHKYVYEYVCAFLVGRGGGHTLNCRIKHSVHCMHAHCQATKIIYACTRFCSVCRCLQI